ncbi:hypothetical protein [Rothia sp. ZJ1223]|uniref:hypothetical protein n=1 Tax=Rothia sp. ZJ1223 TaxID=2811098 RepID=UPI00195CEFB6|nr:hypothetical protein [Rothia sp. ZJ1223]MBM7051258.1 hypothetical protein [Rothia sp. ZJ1223]
MSQDYQETDFFEFDDDSYDEEPHDNKYRWVAVGTMLLAVIITLGLALFGVRSVNEADANEGYEDRTWVISGEYLDLTPDLQTKSNVATYAGNLPADTRLVGMTYKSDLGDDTQVQAVGERIEFRGSQAGSVRADFPEKVDALLAEHENGTLQVVRTGKPGSLQEVTSSTVTTQRIMGWMMVAGALLMMIAGVLGSIFFFRKAA